MQSPAANKVLIQQKAKELGFFYCGIAKAEFLEEEAPQLEQWLQRSYHGKMGYMEQHFDKRLDPRLLVNGAKSVVSLLLNYHNPEKQFDSTAPQISQYAYGEDYHKVIKDKLFDLLDFIRAEIGEVAGRVFVDSAPVMDKAWAKKSGAGWLGKNSNIIHPKHGSFFFIAELIIDLELPADGPIKDYCGTCTRCIDACPTDAIVQPYVVDGSKCISYLTIELKDEIIPSEFKNRMENWAFGCDICQTVCPWNRFASKTEEARFSPQEGLLNLNRKEWQEITEEIFDKLLQNSAIQRTKYQGLKRNINFIVK
ncbi:MAG: tRNA epoxyqueuosine(34) reductase QueG [Bacteroidota bacterium]